jgi:hypothetical protein
MGIFILRSKKNVGIEFEDAPPTLHEIRSLNELYVKEKRKNFARKLLGHQSGK